MKQVKALLWVLLLGIGLLKGQAVTDLETGKRLALTTKKLMIVDFWASWCSPCHVMDAELWHSEAFDKLSDLIVLVKIDFDQQRAIAMRYGVKSLPTVHIMSPNEDLIWSETGFGNADS